MFRLIGFLGMIAGGLFVIFMIAIYGFYFASMITELSQERKTPWTFEELIPSFIAAGLFLSALFAFICAYLIRAISAKKGVKHIATRIVRVFFVLFIGTFVSCFFISSVYIEQYVHTISAHHGYLVCIRNKDKMKMTDILILPDSAKACEEFQSQG